MKKTAEELVASNRWFKARELIVEFLEVIFVAFFLVIASRYWVISEHVAYISLFAATALFSITRRIEGSHSIRRYFPLISYALFILWIVLSSSWSPTFHLSFSRSITVGLIAGIGVAIGIALRPATLGKGLLVGVLFHLGHGFATDGIGPREFLALTASTGLFTNISEMTFLLGVGIVAALWIAARWRNFLLVFLPIIALFTIAATAIPVLTMYFAVIGATAAGFMILHLRMVGDSMRKILRILYPALTLLGILVFWNFRESILRPLGEDPDLSGRTIIWDWYFEAFLWEPLTGIGWGNTYNWPLTPGDIYPTGQYFIAHNGFIDIGLATGVVGVALIATTLVLVFLRGASLALDQAKSLSFLIIPTLVTYVAINDMMATSLPRYIGVFLVGSLVGLVISEPTKSEKPV
jgi:O-antigen ligase